MDSTSEDLHGGGGLAAALRGRLDPILAEALARLEPTIEGSSAPIESWQALLRATLESQLESFLEGRIPPDAPPSESVMVALAEAGELDLVRAMLRLCQQVLWENWFGAVEASGLVPDQRRESLLRGSDFFFRYAAQASERVTSAYHEAGERLPDDNRRRRLRAVRAVLDRQSPLDSPEHLNYDLDQHHLGLIAWGQESGAALAMLLERLERPSLVLEPLGGLIWGWISGSRPFAEREERELCRFEPPPQSTLAFGEVDFGASGFRATHRQAQQARWASRFYERPVVRYGDVAVLSLVAANREEARRFVAHELRGINDENSDSARIRETVAAYFAADHNAASAAARLGVHRQTVANRLRVAEERIGHPVSTRRLELELALRLRACLGGAGL